MNGLGFFFVGIVMTFVALGLADWIVDLRSLRQLRRFETIRRVAQAEIEALSRSTVSGMNNQHYDDDLVDLARLRRWTQFLSTHKPAAQLAQLERDHEPDRP